MKHRILLLLLTASALTGCDGLLVEPRLPATQIGVSFAVADYDPAPLTAILALTDRAEVSLSAGAHSRDTIINIQRGASSNVGRMTLRPEEHVPALQIAILLRVGFAHVFEGSTVVDASGPKTLGETIFVTPIASSLVASISPNPFQIDALGDTSRLAATVTMATGDTLRGATVVWRSLDPDVVEVLPAGDALVPRGNGQTDVLAEYGPLTRLFMLRVHQRAVTLTGVAPADTTISAAGSFALRPFGTDRNGFPLLPGAVGLTWVAVGPFTVSATGVVTATGAGSGFVRVTLGSSVQTANIVVTP